MSTNNAVNTTLSGQTGTGNFVGSTSATLVTPTLGAGTATSLSFFPSTGGIIGTITNDNASAGYVGEYIDSGVINPTFTMSLTVYNLTSISLTKGDWDVYANFLLTPSSFNTDQLLAGISTTSTTLPSPGMNYIVQAINGAGPTGLGGETAFCFQRISVSGTTTVYFTGQATWSGGSAPTCFVQMVARRVR